MKLRILAAITLLFAPNAGATILSASSQAVREPSSGTAVLQDAATVQHDLNTSLSDAATGAASISLGALPGASAGSSPLTDGSTSFAYQQFNTTSASSGLFPLLSTVAGLGVIAILYHTESTSSIRWDPAGSRLGPMGGLPGGGGIGRREPHATPEPATWLLLVSGLLLAGTYACLRHRFSAETSSSRA
jgi:hypothetical protein